MKRVVIIGNSGAGKSTLTATLSKRTGLPLIASAPSPGDAAGRPHHRRRFGSA